MSDRYIPVQWNRNKWLYDAVLLAFVATYILVFLRLGAPAADLSRGVDGAILRMRAFGSCAFFLLTVILCVGPLARLDHRFLPLLYNRRHFGVMTAIVAVTHATYVLSWYYAFSPSPQLVALLGSNTSFGQILGFPFEVFGIFALLVLAILAATSHDFWLSFLSPPVWKRLHLLIYPAYAAVIAHVALGYLQDTKNPAFALAFGVSGLAVAGLHLAAYLKDRAGQRGEGAWIPVAAPGDFTDGRAKIVPMPDGRRAAVFRDGARIGAVSNACAHQNGPLGEGRIIDGCITCPWHGFQYRLEDGCSPPPFTEKIPTYEVRLKDGMVAVSTTANPPGTPVTPLEISEFSHG